MAKRHRVMLTESLPSKVLLVKHGIHETEKLLLEGDGINAMVNEDGTISIEVYTNSRSIILRMSPEDTKAQAHVFRRWRELK